MKKLCLLLIGLLVAGIVFWLAGKVGGPPDPKYQGRRLSTILKNESDARYTLESGEVVRFVAEDVRAIRQMGTNAIPYLLKEMRATDSTWKWKLEELASRQSFVSIRFVKAQYHHDRASQAFAVLGPVGAPAIHELAKLFDQAERGYFAIVALQGIGEKSLSVLLPALAHSNETVRRSAATALGTFSSSGPVVVPALIQSLGDLESDVRVFVVQALGQRHQEAALAVPALVQLLEDSEERVRSAAVYALERFGAEAKSAIPALLKARATSDAGMRFDIDQAILAIDPEAAVRAGIK